MTRNNNVVSFLMTVVINVISFALYLIPNFIYRFNQQSKSQIVFFVPLLAITLMLFIYAGRYVLRDTGSLVKNALSVTLPFIVGILCVIGIAVTRANGASLLWLYFAYSASFTGIVGVIHHLHNPDFFTSLTAPLVFSVVPSLLFTLGLQWQTK